MLARGDIPADILFVGEAPGASEDVRGRPFDGPAGKLLDGFIEAAGMGSARMAFTNLIACIPKDDSGNKTIEPPDFAIKACAPRLAEFIEIVKPKLIVLVGKHAEKYVNPSDDYTLEKIIHPAAILRGDATAKINEDILIQRTVTTLRDAYDSLGL